MIKEPPGPMETEHQRTMQPEGSTFSRVSFGLFEADLRSGELRKSGIRVKVQSQPFRVLTALLERPGEVVTREELQQRLWGIDTTVDFDHSLGTAVNKIREALGDSADNPRFIETLAKRGYRFIAPVTRLESSPTDSTSASTLQSSSFHPVAVSLPEIERQTPTSPSPLPPAMQIPPSLGRQSWQYRKPAVAATIVAALALMIALSAWSWGHGTPPIQPAMVSQITFSGRVSPGDALFESLPASANDGSRLFFLQIQDGRTALSQALIVDGESSLLSLPSEIASPSLGDISPDGSKLLVRNHLAPDAEQPLWIVPTLGGGARRLSNALAHDGTWMPDGKRILIANGNDLIVTREDGTDSRKLATLPGRAFWLRWSPDGSKLRFTLIDPKDHTTSLWEAAADGRRPHRLLHGVNGPQMECCGNWTADGKYFIFQMTHGGRTNIWGMTEKSSFLGPGPYIPWQITNGPLSYQAPTTARTGHQIFFLGLDSRYDLLRYDSTQKEFVPFGKNLHSVGRTAFSRDGQWVAWVRPGDGSLWCSRSNGNERLQLTASPMQVFVLHWSPDDRQIAFMGREPGMPWKIYLVSATGGTPQMLLQEDRNEADPDWSPDGRRIVFGRPPEVMAEGTAPKAIHILDLETRQVTTLPGSDGMFSPRWSPDGRYIAATPLGEGSVKIFDLVKSSWTTLLATHTVSDLEWSHDGNWIYFHDYIEDGAPLYRVSIDKKLERVADLSSLHAVDAVDYSFSGLAPGDVPMLRARMWTANIYSLDLDHR